MINKNAEQALRARLKEDNNPRPNPFKDKDWKQNALDMYNSPLWKDWPLQANIRKVGGSKK